MKSFMAALRSLVLPWGRTSGRRIVLDGEKGWIGVYDSQGKIAAAITLAGGAENDAGFVSVNTNPFGRPYYAMLTGGEIEFGEDGRPYDAPPAISHGVRPDGRSALLFGSGYVGAGGEWDGAVLRLLGMSAAGSRPRGELVSSSGEPVELVVGGAVRAQNLPARILAGRVQTPTPGTVPGQTTATVTFPEPMPTVPRISLTLVSTSTNLAAANIHGAVTNITTSGFTAVCHRDTNSSTNWDWTAISP